jgi:hypothetical protein
VVQKRVIILFTIILSLSLISNYSCTEQTKKAYEQSTVPITTLYAAKEQNDLGVELTNEAKYEEAITGETAKRYRKGMASELKYRQA